MANVLQVVQRRHYTTRFGSLEDRWLIVYCFNAMPKMREALILMVTELY